MKHFKTIFGNMLLIASLLAILAMPISFMGTARFTDLPVLGTQNVREKIVETQKPRPRMSATTKRFVEQEPIEQKRVETVETTQTTATAENALE